MPVWSEEVEAVRPEDAEWTVRSLRADLREAEALKERGDARGYRRARERAGNKMAAIGKMLEYRFAKRAERHFGDNPPLIQEAVEEAFELLYQDLMNLEPGKRFYEITFNRCVLWTNVKAIREVRKRHGMRMNVKGSSDDEKAEDLKRERARIPERIESRAEVGERTNVLEDKETQAAMERFAGPNLMKDILAAMPDHRHRKVLILHAIKKRTFASTAEIVGVSERTARRCYKKAAGIAVETVRRQK